jgi:hypothetical protein
MAGRDAGHVGSVTTRVEDEVEARGPSLTALIPKVHCDRDLVRAPRGAPSEDLLGAPIIPDRDFIGQGPVAIGVGEEDPPVAGFGHDDGEGITHKLIPV